MSIRSMTGYGRAEANGYVVSFSTTNRRQFDASFSLPKSLSVLESRIVDLLKKDIHRGRVAGTIQAPPDTTLGATVNLALAERVVAQLRELGKKLDLAGDVTLAELIRVPELLTTRVEDQDPEEAWEQLSPAIAACVEQLIASRDVEGASLQEDLKERVQTLKTFHAQIEEKAAGFVERKRADLLSKLKEADLPVALDDERLLREIAYYADRSDITEELIRIQSHFDQVEDAMNTVGPVGRGLDFLCQELHREINTIGSKSSEADISKLVIAFKTELERVREQMQNVE